MKVTVQYFAIIRELVNLREEVLNLKDGITVLELLAFLSSKHEKLKEYIIDPKTGEPRTSIQYLLGDKLISALNGFSTTLQDGSVFAIIPPVGGG
ncbi:MAG TPA: MoaD/ThiS family protein [Candidatus Acidoferrum sp.]|nr:MoaD/ThiS family protein [Candidatus Acidoferrum sp.]